MCLRGQMAMINLDSVPPAAGGVGTDGRLQQLSTMRRVRDRIDRDRAHPLDVVALARSAEMAPGQLSDTFRHAFGQSPYLYLITRRGMLGVDHGPELIIATTN